MRIKLMRQLKFKCKDCFCLTSALCNGRCEICTEKHQKRRIEKIAVRMSPDQFNLQKLINMLLHQHWMHHCEIITDFKRTVAALALNESWCVVKYTYESGATTFLRSDWVAVPIFHWDIGPDNFHTPELALLALNRSPAPPNVEFAISTYGM